MNVYITDCREERSMLKNIKWNVVLVSLAQIVAGVLLIVFPQLSSDVICYIVGAAACLYGLVNLVSYFLLKLEDSLFRNEFVYGIMGIIAGAVIMFKRDIIIDLIPIVLGLIIVFNGFTKLQRAVVAMRIRYSKAPVFAVMGLISIVLGIVIMFFLSGQKAQEILFRTIGGALIFCGLSDIVSLLFLTNKFNTYIDDFKAGKVPAPAPAPEQAETQEPLAAADEEEEEMFEYINPEENK